MHQDSHGIQLPIAREQFDEGGSTSNRGDEKVNMDLMHEVEKDAEDEDLQKVDKPNAFDNLVDGMQEGTQVCRVCQCVDLEKTGEAALKSLGIRSPAYSKVEKTTGQVHSSKTESDGTCTSFIPQLNSTAKNDENISKDISCLNDSLIKLGCACKSDLSWAHYACALRWFVGRDSLVCEICGVVALNISVADRDKVISTLKERESLLRSSTHRLANALSWSVHTMTPFSLAYTEAGSDDVSWFDPHIDLMHNLSDPIIDIPEERHQARAISPAAKWAVEGTGILVATGLLTVTITWLLAPRVSKVVARKGMNILLAGLSALAIVIFLRFGVLPRIKDGSARYWAILVVFWFLIFGVWASSTRSAHASP